MLLDFIYIMIVRLEQSDTDLMERELSAETRTMVG